MRDALKKLKSPATEIRAMFDTNILLSLKPDIFLKLCLITELLSTETKPEQFYIDRMNNNLNKAHLAAQIKKESRYMQWV